MRTTEIISVRKAKNATSQVAAVTPFEGERNKDEWEYFDRSGDDGRGRVDQLREVAEWSAGIDQAK
jgi:hypothetical protein